MFKVDDFPLFSQPHVMVDTETLARGHNAVITSIGATRFSFTKPGTYDHFKVNIDPTDAKRYGLKIQQDTVDWWKTQPKEAIRGWTSNPRPLEEAINSFEEWWMAGPKKQQLWCNGLSFDVPIIRDSFKVLGKEVPWPYYHENDMRTLLNFMGARDGFKKKREDSGTYHDSLGDAIAQAETLLDIFQVAPF
jgi:hypothetical protein